MLLTNIRATVDNFIKCVIVYCQMKRFSLETSFLLLKPQNSFNAAKLTGWDVQTVVWISEDRNSISELRFTLQQHSFSVWPDSSLTFIRSAFYWMIIIPNTTFVKPINQRALAPSAVLSLTVTYILKILLVFSKLPSLYWHQCSTG